MSMPTIPEELFRPTIREAVIDLFKSIAMEETAISHLLNAEAEKIQAFVGHQMDFPTNPTNLDILRFNQSVTKLVDIIVMKEWLLFRKLETSLEILAYDNSNENHYEDEYEEE
ncbi:hypothetical protein EHS13_17220 [Paenibacillus psychroresistens]|uniref:Uncharacterized protein n=1 Tax=Paenibacillus psychroresistens TaxID=1778678 RepID=A0A6B8RJ58_9BACL|nr:hypothetical protein [Paenibacillus psychroresistens]QGQ96501.1 hypothetical protein EHS13_17220 [Paenibacillus psychroresistens]